MIERKAGALRRTSGSEDGLMFTSKGLDMAKGQDWTADPQWRRDPYRVHAQSR